MTTLGYAILGLLAREALSGYDLTQRMKGRVGYFWSARHSQIYPELARLEAGGYVSHDVIVQQERPDKKVYEITPEGLEALEEWATRSPVERPSRDELVLKASSLWLADPAESARLFREEENRHEEQLAHYKGIRAWMEGEWGEDLARPDTPEFASYATLRRGIIHEKGYAAWCRWVADSIEGKPASSKKGKKKNKKGRKKGA